MMRPGTLAMSSALALMLAGGAVLLRGPADAGQQSGAAAQPAPATASQKASTAESAHVSATGSESTPPAAQNAAAANVGPYEIKNGRVGVGIFHGYLFYGEYCLRCHGPDGYGSSYAPSLVSALKTISEREFKETVINGKQNVSTSSELVMPAFGTVADVVLHLNDIYAYLKAESEGNIARGRPKQLND